MSWFADLRALVFLRRITRAMERSADSQETIARILSEEWAVKNPVRRKTQAIIGSLNLDETEKLWHQQRKERFEEPD